jgi:endonuclease I
MEEKMKITIIILVFLSAIFLIADIPEGYYDGTEGVNGEELKTVLHNIIDNHVEYSYNFLRDVLLPYSDEDPNNSSNVILLYTGWSISKNDFGGGASDWNREHTWAKSHGGFGDTPPMGTDAHHLRACDASVNSRRGNLDFDNGGSEYIDGDGATGCNVTSVSWEPRDEDKGDVARMLFYMAVRYEGGGGELDLELVDNTNSSPSGQPYHGKFSTLLTWHHQDPPDAREMQRNDRVFDYQENRNPFIDYPDFVARIWEGANSELTILPLFSDVEIYPNPFNPSTTIQFTSLHDGNIAVAIYNTKGQKVKTLLEQEKTQNQLIELTWNGKDTLNKAVSSGIYYCVVNAGSETKATKIMLLK